jgi:hypothetical protein
VRPEKGGIFQQETGVFQFIFSGLSKINVVELWNCPIVFDISIWKINAVPESRWNVPDRGWRLLFHNQVSAIDEAKGFASKTIQRNPDALLVEVNSSYGGSMAFICDAIEVFHDTNA